jgi:hypothetical protein
VFSGLRFDCSDLTKYAIHVRYPFEIEIEDKDVQKAIVEAKRVIDVVSNRLNPSK